MAEEVNTSGRLESFEKAMKKMIGTNDKAIVDTQIAQVQYLIIFST